MAMTYQIDSGRRLVTACANGTLKDAEVFAYQEEVWSRDDVVGFDELVDMTDVRDIILPSIERVHELAALAARMGRGAPPSRLAIVAPDDLSFGLGRLFGTSRESAAPGNKTVAVFRTKAKALAWLGIDAAGGNDQSTVEVISQGSPASVSPAQG